MNHKIKWVPIATSMLLAFSVGCSSEDGDDAPSSWVSSSSSEWSSSSSNTSTSTPTNSSSSSSSTTFSSESLQQKILRHAGYAVADIEGYRFNTVLNNGFQQYEAVFYARSDGKTEEHTYYLSTTDATILSNTVVFLPPDYIIEEEEEELVTDDTGITFESIAGQLTQSQAKAIVTQDAGVSEFSISGFTINERTSGTIQEYEITFGTNTADYYYTIMAASGIITFSRMTPLETATQPNTSTTTPPSTGTTTTPSTGTTTTPSTGTTTTPSTGTTTTPNTGTTTTPSTTPTTPEIPDVVVPDVVIPEATVPEVSTPVAPSLSNLDAKNAALRFAGVSESEIDRLAITELTDSTGSVYEYQVDFFHQVNFHTYRVSASTGAVRIT